MVDWKTPIDVSEDRVEGLAEAQGVADRSDARPSSSLSVAIRTSRRERKLRIAINLKSMNCADLRQTMSFVIFVFPLKKAASPLVVFLIPGRKVAGPTLVNFDLPHAFADVPFIQFLKNLVGGIGPYRKDDKNIFFEIK